MFMLDFEKRLLTLLHTNCFKANCSKMEMAGRRSNYLNECLSVLQTTKLLLMAFNQTGLPLYLAAPNKGLVQPVFE